MNIEKLIIRDDLNRELYIPFGRLARLREVESSESKSELLTKLEKVTKKRLLLSYLVAILSLTLLFSMLFKKEIITNILLNVLIVLAIIYPLILSFIMCRVGKDMKKLSWKETFLRKPCKLNLKETILALTFLPILLLSGKILIVAGQLGVGALFLAYGFYILFPIVMSIYAKLF